MKLIQIILLLLLSLNYSYSFTYKPRLYNRIPKFFVHDRIYNFLERNGINNCYEHLEESKILLLKCYHENKLMNVEISIKSDKQKNNYLSIYI